MESEFKVYSASAGSGKTFTLVKEYLKIILQNPDDKAFKAILAITFTNKAAGEMKERVLKGLEDFSKADLTKKWDPLFQIISDELKPLSPVQIKQKSKRVLHQIMQNYGAFSITTIDSFTHRLIRSFAFDLGIPLDFEIEMDEKAFIAEAVDLLLDQLGENKEITKALNGFIHQKIDQDKDWNISRDLNEIAKILINEVDMLEFRNFKSQSLSDFKDLESGMLKEQAALKGKIEAPAKQALELITRHGILPESFSGKILYNWMVRATDLDANLKELKINATVEKFLQGGNAYPKKATDDQKQRIDEISDELRTYTQAIAYAIEVELPRYNLFNNLRRELIPLAVLNQIAQILEDLKTDSGIKFIAEFNSIISESISDQPAPFIFEKLGERYRYFFIDEMQDTSEMQWSNLIPLLHNALSSEGAMLMLVGDGKQSIYRWRGGKAEQFIELSSHEPSETFLVDRKLSNLGTNFRSFAEIIDFNNSFFTHLSSALSNTDYRNMYANQNNQEKSGEKSGGYVYYKSFDHEDKEKKEALLLEDIVRIIEQRDPAYKLGDICVLVRGGEDGVKVADYLTEKGYPIVSSETLRLVNSAEVNFLIDCLSSIFNPDDAQARVRMLNFLMPKDIVDKDAYFESFSLKDFSSFLSALKENNYQIELNQFESMPLYDGLEYLIRVFKLNKDSNAYLQFFLDFVIEFQNRNFAGIGQFLEDWDRKKEDLSIVSPESDQAIQIMTVHKSKGLEFPVVISAFAFKITPQQGTTIWATMPENEIFQSFPRLRIPVSSSSEGLSEQVDLELSIFNQENELDNINLLYVAFTRAAEQLYILMQKPHRPDAYTYKYLEQYIHSESCKLQLKDGAYVSGSPKRPDNAMSKEKAPLLVQNKLISTPWEDHDIRVLQEGSRYWESKQGEAIEFGNKVHQVMADIKSSSDKEYALEKALAQGMINREERVRIAEYMDKIFEHPSLKDYYKPGLKIMNERTMIGANGEVLIPDRLVYSESGVSILDYKTGAKDIKYLDQLDAYAYVLGQMNLKVEKKILIYAGEELDVEVY